MPQQQPEGPAGVYFTDEDLLIIWQTLTRNPTGENSTIRERIARYFKNYKETELHL